MLLSYLIKQLEVQRAMNYIFRCASFSFIQSLQSLQSPHVATVSIVSTVSTGYKVYTVYTVLQVLLAHLRVDFRVFFRGVPISYSRTEPYPGVWWQW